MNNIWITIKKELRGIIRDKKSLMMMILTPLMIPTYMILFSSIYNTQIEENTTEEKTYQIGVNYTLTEKEKEITKTLQLETKYYDSKESLDKAYQKKKITSYIMKENEKYIVYSNTAETDSIESMAVVMNYLDTYNTYLGHEYLSNFPVDINKVEHSIEIQTEELEGTSELVNMILFLGIVFSMMAISLTAIYGVTDSIAGEKERGTLETILTFPIKSKELITGKYLAITTSCIITSIISSILVVVSITFSKNHYSVFDGAILNLNVTTMLLILLLMISYSFFVSGLCIAIASFTRSYKEAQSALTPVSMMTMIPMMMNVMEISLNTKLSFIPVISHTMLINDIVTLGITKNTLLYLGIILISTFIYSFIIVRIIGMLYKNEKVLFST